MFQQGGRQVSLSTFPSAFPKILILNRFSEAVSDLHLFLLYDSSWQAWLLLIAAFVLLSVAFLPNSNLLPLLSWYMTYDCLSLSPHRFVVGFQLLLVFREHNTTKAKINLYLNPSPKCEASFGK